MRHFFNEFPARTSPRAAKAESGVADSGEIAALTSAMETSTTWWSARLDAMNAETARLLFRDSRVMLWIALGTSWLVDLIWRVSL